MIIKNLEDRNDSELILAWYQGNDHAFEVLYERYIIYLLEIAIQKTGNKDIAEELVQDTFMNLYSQKPRVLEIHSVRAYLYVVLKNKVLNYYREELIRKKYLTYLLNRTTDFDNSTLSGIETRELERQIVDEIERLPPRCRTVFKLSRNDFLSNKAIAIKLNISENTVEQHIRKALKHIRKSVKVLLRILLVINLS